MERSLIPKPADRDAWLEVRRPYFNASAAAVLWDRHPYMTQAHYAAGKLSGRDDPENRDMHRGNVLEDPIAQWWADDHHHLLGTPQSMYRCDHLLYTADRITENGELVEVKTARGFVSDPEVHWLDQCQAACLCADKPGIHLVWFDSTLDYGYLWVERDEKWGQAIYDASKQFMAFIEMGMVPEGVHLTYKQLAGVHLLATVAKVVLSDDEYQWVQALATAKATRLAAERDEERIKAELARILGDAEEGWWRSAPVITWRNDRPSTQLDWRSMAKEHRDIAKQYEKPKLGVRRMLVVGQQREEEVSDE
jgi:hypothetical protein